MAFSQSGRGFGNGQPSMGGLYAAGQKTQQRFQSGWTPSYLRGYQAPQTCESNPFHTQFNAPQSRLVRVNLAVDASASAPASAPSAQYFMAGDGRCPYTVKAREQNAPNVVALKCGIPAADGGDASHPVCKLNSAAGRGVPSYYKQTSADAYEFVHSGYDKTLAFLKS